MSLNCLRMDSEENMKANRLDEEDNHRHNFKLWLGRVERSWSGNLAPDIRPNSKRMRARSNLGPISSPIGSSGLLHRVHNVGPTSSDSAPNTPRLVRSSGMRRDWSFEDVRRALEG